MVLLRDHLEGQDTIQSELYAVVAQQQDPNVYMVQSVNKKGHMHKATID